MFALRQVARNLNSKRSFVKSAICRHGHHGPGSKPGEDLPFDISNRYKVTLIMTTFIATGMAIPFLLVRHQLLK